MSWQRPNIGSRMNREVHVRVWERAEVKFLRATRQNENPSSTPPIPLAAVASAASGQMVATTPSRVMNSRRLMADPVEDHKLPHCARQQNWLSGGDGSIASISRLRVTSAHPPKAALGRTWRHSRL